MAVWLEDEVKDLGCADRLRWAGALNDANYYHESSTNGFFDGLAACLSVLADRFETVQAEGAHSAFFMRNAAEELWALTGDARRWKDADRLPLAVALQHLESALEIESRKIDFGGPNA
jgi:hypothetical protein